MAALLNSLEDQQQLSEKQEKELNESKLRERALMIKQKRLEKTCHEQDEQIHSLSINLSKLSTSMQDVNSPKHSTPMRNASSAYFPSDDDELHEDNDSHVRPMYPPQTNVSLVAPMRRQVQSASGYHDDSNDRLVDHDRGVHHSVSEGKTYKLGPGATNNYYNTSYDSKNRTEGFDNVGVVRPNNSRTVVDVDFDNSRSPLEQDKKKKKGFMKVFQLCTGKSSKTPPRYDSMYHKSEPSKITMTTYTNE